MALIYTNITGNTATVIYDHLEGAGSVMYDTMTLCNVHASDSVDVDLYLTRTHTTGNVNKDGSDPRTYVGEFGNWDALPTTTKTYYKLKNVTIPKGVTLQLDSDILGFDYTKYSLYIKLSASDSAVDMIINDSKKKRKSRTSGRY